MGTAPLLSRSVNRVLEVVLLNPGRAFFQRELSRLTGEAYNGVRQALARLVREGVVERIAVGGRPAFRANTGNPYFGDLQRIVIRSLAIPEALDQAGVTALKVVVFGSFAKGVAEEGSDLDVLVVGREQRVGDAQRALGPIAGRIECQISVALYDHARYRDEMERGAGFVYAVASGPTIDLRGSL